MTGAVAAFPLARQMILVLTWNWVIKDDPPASSTWVRQLISYVTILGIGCVLAAGIGVTIGVLAGRPRSGTVDADCCPGVGNGWALRRAPT
jgi:hypothetical protein